MRRTLAITLLAVFLFQLVGYYFVYFGLSIQANKSLISRIDAHDYSVDQTLTLKIPFTLPYWTDKEQFERVDGDFEYQGQFYKLVKQKLENDTLYVVCIKNQDKKQLFDSLTEYIKFSSDQPATSKQALKIWGSIVKDYIPNELTALTHCGGWSITNDFARDDFSLFASPLTFVISPPPEA
ncbi:hypothetical protein WBG78_18065 [Chryseolinea sp. T2]|uniref:hypothetical protein n=1 Tax=Chryseolinea sp. T2 TaxID=3129255 RepID=UPI0030783A0A